MPAAQTGAISYLECAGASHAEATARSPPEILALLVARRDGEAFEAECTRPAPVTCAGTPP